MAKKIIEFSEELSVTLCGQAGQGIKTIENIMSKILKKSGYNVFTTTEYMSRIRGGFNSTEIRISSKPVMAFVEKINILISIGRKTFGHLEEKIDEDTIVVGEKAETKIANEYIEVPFEKIATEVGNKIYSNTVAVGLTCGLLGINKELFLNYLEKYFSKFSEKIILENIEAAKKGYSVGEELSLEKIRINIPVNHEIDSQIILDGSEAVSMGAIAGGCKFISAYPMAPSTGILKFLAKEGKKFDIIAEQAEDEIGAINMCTGAWCAGARAMVTTSGGGFALMGEGLSNAGIMEIPIVVHLAQRPGPATGLPTRTVQGDLELALYSGHGDFPRILYSPRTLQDCFLLTGKAFNLADKHQIIAIILTDSFLVNSTYNIPAESLDFEKVSIEHAFVKTEKDYERYKLTEDNISPRGVFGYGEGLISYDSHEHTEDGHINENFELTVKMQEKRIKKLDDVEIEPPELTGKEDYKILIVGWGSTYGVIKEALDKINREDISFLSFSQVYPLHKSTEGYMKKAEKVIIVENNLTGQFAKLIRMYTGIEIKNKILKYNGLPFSVEEVVREILKKI